MHGSQNPSSVPPQCVACKLYASAVINLFLLDKQILSGSVVKNLSANARDTDLV